MARRKWYLDDALLAERLQVDPQEGTCDRISFALSN